MVSRRMAQLLHSHGCITHIRRLYWSFSFGINSLLKTGLDRRSYHAETNGPIQHLVWNLGFDQGEVGTLDVLDKG